MLGNLSEPMYLYQVFYVPYLVVLESRVISLQLGLLLMCVDVRSSCHDKLKNGGPTNKFYRHLVTYQKEPLRHCDQNLHCRCGRAKLLTMKPQCTRRSKPIHAHRQPCKKV